MVLLSDSRWQMMIWPVFSLTSADGGFLPVRFRSGLIWRRRECRQGEGSALGERTQPAPAHLCQQRHGGVDIDAVLGIELFDDDLGGADESPAQKLGLVVFQRCEVLQGSDHTCGRPLTQIAQLL